MNDYFTALLEKKCQEENCMILYSEWLREKEMAIRILSNVSNMSSHFSIHDHTHSEAILKYIKSFLGREVLEKKFTATDLWMLLFAAYYHDIGMVVKNADIEKIFTDKDENRKFITKVKEIRNDQSSPLHENAQIFEKEIEKGKILKLKDAILNGKLLPKLLTIFTEFFREKHADRSQQFINDLYTPESSIKEMGITSLIPQRLFRTLGVICASHGYTDFSQVLAIEEREVGLGEGDAHPRFIACLLRLGDVLDIDNNRFNPTALAYMGEDNLPSDTRYHIRKHLSIKHFCVSPEVIDITAEIKLNEETDDKNKDESFDVDAYNVAEVLINWFKWLREEFERQKVYINQIVPSGYEVQLPYVKRAECRLANYLYLEDKKKPRFEIDSPQAFELLQGMNLYTEPWQSIREIIQNSIDATLIRYWTANREELKREGEEEKDVDWYRRVVADIKNGLKKYPIVFKVIEDTKVQTDTYTFAIEDNGIGISQEDLKYLLKVGSAKKNKKKRELIENMPRWFRPSGAFGIGFQSLFLLTDSVSILTKSAETGQKISVKLFSPNGPHKGDVLIRELETRYEEAPFTSVKFSISKEKLSRIDSVQPLYMPPVDKQPFDVLENWSKDFNLNCMLLALSQYVQLSPVPVFFKSDNVERVFPTTDFFEETLYEVKLEPKEEDYDGMDSQFLQLRYIVDPSKTCYSGNTQIYFKNQYVCQYESESYPFVHLKLNFTSGRAIRWLTLDRNSIKDDQKRWLHHFFRKMLANVLSMEKNMDVEMKQRLSLLDYVFLNQHRDQTPIWLDGLWKNYEVANSDGVHDSKSIGTIINSYQRLEILLNYDTDFVHYENEVLKISAECSSDQYNYWIMLIAVFKEHMRKVKWSADKIVFYDKSMNIPKEGKYTIEIDDWEESIRNAINKPDNDHYLLPCQEQYMVLAIDASKTTRVCGQFLPFDLDSNCNNLMVSPFTKLNKNKQTIVSDAFVDYVYQNLLNQQNMTKEKIKSLYQKFIKDYGQA